MRSVSVWLIALLAAAGCDLGSVPAITADAGPPGDAGDCIPAATPPNGRHNPNTNCLNGCHGDGTDDAPIFTVAGTLAETAGASPAVPGATVTLTDNVGSVITMVTADNGNFFTDEAIEFPATVEVSLCPDTVAMPDPITTGNCIAGCHVAGGTAGGRIHLP